MLESDLGANKHWRSTDSIGEFFQLAQGITAKFHQYVVCTATCCKGQDIWTLQRKTAEDMIVHGLHTSEMPISILSVSSGNVAAPYLNCTCERQALDTTSFQELHLVVGSSRKALGHMEWCLLLHQGLFTQISHFRQVQFHVLLLSRVSAVTMQFLMTRLPHLLKRISCASEQRAILVSFVLPGTWCSWTLCLDCDFHIFLWDFQENNCFYCCTVSPVHWKGKKMSWLLWSIWTGNTVHH